MCWILLLIILLSSVLVGWFAQSWKKQTGALWGLITLLVEVAAFLVLSAYAWLRTGRLRVLGLRPLTRGLLLPWGVAVALGVGLVMALVVATLPMLGREDSEDI